jgi:hypothetical protein
VGAGRGWVLGVGSGGWRGGNPLAPGPLGSVFGGRRRAKTPTGTGAGAGSPPPPSCRQLAAGGRGGPRPRVFAAHGPVPQLRVHAPAWGGGGVISYQVNALRLPSAKARQCDAMQYIALRLWSARTSRARQAASGEAARPARRQHCTSSQQGITPAAKSQIAAECQSC